MRRHGEVNGGVARWRTTAEQGSAMEYDGAKRERTR